MCAATEEWVIGKTNQTPWYLPADLTHFKQLTTGHLIVMGRKTYQSIGRPLSNRESIVITRNKDFTAPGCTVVHSIEASLELIKSNTRKCFIIGGAEIFKAYEKYAECIYLTQVHARIEGDTIFRPQLLNWKVIYKEDFPADSKNPYPYSFITMEKIL